MSARYRALSADALPEFLEANAFSVVHLDADWDGYRTDIQTQIESIMDTMPDVAFGYIDVDQNSGFASAMHATNLPACVYYRESEPIAVVIGRKQNIFKNLMLIRMGKVPKTMDAAS